MKRVQEDTGKRVLFTGPDGIGDYRPRLDYFPRSIGIGLLSPDATSDLEYLFRPGLRVTRPLPKHCYIGEVGWGLQYSSQLNRRSLAHNKQNEFDGFLSLIDGATHSQRPTSPQFWDKHQLSTNNSTCDTHGDENNTKTQLTNVIYKQEGQPLSTEKDQTGGITFPQI